MVSRAPSTATTTHVSLVHSQVDITVEGLRLNFHGALSGDGERISGKIANWNDDSLIDFDLYRVRPRRSVDAGQLRKLMAGWEQAGKRDGDLAKELNGLRLTERVDHRALVEEQAELPGMQSRESLRMLADESAFLDSPAEEMGAGDKPELARQRAIAARAVDYVVNAVHHMPNFLATRVTTTYRRDPWQPDAVQKVRRTEEGVVYRDGEEELQSGKARGFVEGLTTSGEFGPILGTLIVDAAKGDLAWSHWEGPGQRLAVFRYAVDAEHSHYRVDGMATGYRGEFAVDPQSGAIERLVFKADPPSDDQLAVAEIAVEYGPVELGGGKYMCPLRGYAVSEGLKQMMLNDVAFEGYHVFHATMKVLPGEGR